MSQKAWLAESVPVPRELIEDAIDALIMTAEHWAPYRYGEYRESADRLRALIGVMPDPSPDERAENLRRLNEMLAEKARVGGWDYEPIVESP